MESFNRWDRLEEVTPFLKSFGISSQQAIDFDDHDVEIVSSVSNLFDMHVQGECSEYLILTTAALNEAGRYFHARAYLGIHCIKECFEKENELYRFYCMRVLYHRLRFERYRNKLIAKINVEREMSKDNVDQKGSNIKHKIHYH